MGGLLIGGTIVPVDGARVITRADAPWAFLDPVHDCRPRSRRTSSGVLIPPQQYFLHKTIADDPEKLLANSGPSDRAGGAEDTAEAWQRDPAYSGAHNVTGHDGETACLADLLYTEAYHATVSNPYSVGHEFKELPGGGFYEACAHGGILVVVAGCDELGIQKQMPKLGHYKNAPLKRMINGGHDCVGVFGHRDNTDRRGRWDPGDLLFGMLAALGFEQFDYDAGEDLDVWAKRQHELVAKGHALVVDGIPGPATRAALEADGYKRGIWANGKN